MRPNSIIATAAAKSLLDSLTGASIAMQTEDGIWMRGRRTKHGTLVLRLEASTPAYQHTSRTRMKRTHYIRTANEHASVAAHFERLRRERHHLLPLLAARESLYLLTETRAVPDTWADNPPLARPMDYDAMSLEDVAAWTPLVQALPLKA